MSLVKLPGSRQAGLRTLHGVDPCHYLLQQSLDKMLTLHVRSRVFPQLEDAAQFIHAITGEPQTTLKSLGS